MYTTSTKRWPVTVLIFFLCVFNGISQITSTSFDAFGAFGGVSSSANYRELGLGGQSFSIGIAQNSIYQNEAGFVYLLINLSNPTVQEILLQNGWNIFSLHVYPDNANMLSILQPLIDEGILVKVQDETGAAIEIIPGSGTWLNNIGDWTVTEGYKIRLNAPSILSVAGQPATQPVAISLLAGWNIIGYPASSSQEALAVLDELITSNTLLKVQSETGTAIEPMPLNAGWIDNIGNFEPGEGYKVRVSNNDLLTITPTGSAGLKSAQAFSSAPQHFIPAWEGNGYDHMNIYLTEISNPSGLQSGDEIAVYDGDICVGAAVVNNPTDKFLPVAVSADDPVTPETDGFMKGHAMHFRIWRANDNKEIPVNSVRFFAGYTDVFEPMGTTAASVYFPAEGPEGLITSLGDNYPNPFQLETTFEFTLGETLPVNITLFNLLGEKVKILVSQKMDSGSYTAVWNATDQGGNKVPPGIYICKMIAGNYVSVKTIEVMQ
ncbi:MAG: T9SS type A sorting domain-containing protein [Bacteroidales bacterium]|nr:T9SS type A sorting domain-containing protein [Bacteroidales bacterium]